MDTAKRLFQARKRRRSYEPVAVSPEESEHAGRAPERDQLRPRFSWIEYGVFLLLGIAMLWAWNMFLAAAPYFQRRFRTNATILSNFQAAEVSVSTVANLIGMLVLAKAQANASYPRRILTSLFMWMGTYTLLAASTKLFLSVSAGGYFAFLVLMILMSSVATAFMQNGTFAFASGFGRPEYLQAMMTGQGIAGVLPPLVQIATVMSAGDAADDDPNRQQSYNAAFAYFVTAIGVSGLAILAFLYLLRRGYRSPETDSAVETHGRASHSDDESAADADRMPPDHTAKRESVPLRTLARKLFFPASAVFVTFAVTMVFPVFTQAITSANPSGSPLLRDAAFIPFAFLVWNVGDLIGRVIPSVPRLSLALRPRILLILALSRLVFIPLYLLCNIHHPAEAEMATVKSDVFYLLVVQLPFGLTNGYLGSCCMMGSGACVDEDEREAAGGFMGLFLVGGLSVGSLCSFFVGNAL